MLELAIRKRGAGGGGNANAVLVLAGGVAGDRRLRDIWTVVVPSNPIPIAMAGEHGLAFLRENGLSHCTMAVCHCPLTPVISDTSIRVQLAYSCTHYILKFEY